GELDRLAQSSGQLAQSSGRDVHIAAIEAATNVERVMLFLQSQQGGVTIKGIVDGAGVAVSSVRNILYIRYPDRFRQVGRDGRNTLWQLARRIEDEDEPKE